MLCTGDGSASDLGRGYDGDLAATFVGRSTLPLRSLESSFAGGGAGSGEPSI